MQSSSPYQSSYYRMKEKQRHHIIQPSTQLKFNSHVRKNYILLLKKEIAILKLKLYCAVMDFDNFIFILFFNIRLMTDVSVKMPRKKEEESIYPQSKNINKQRKYDHHTDTIN